MSNEEALSIAGLESDGFEGEYHGDWDRGAYIQFTKKVGNGGEIRVIPRKPYQDKDFWSWEYKNPHTGTLTFGRCDSREEAECNLRLFMEMSNISIE